MKKCIFVLFLVCFEMYGILTEVSRLKGKKNLHTKHIPHISLFGEEHDVDEFPADQAQYVRDALKKYNSSSDSPLCIYVEKPPYFGRNASRGMGKLYDIMVSNKPHNVYIKDCEVRRAFSAFKVIVTWCGKKEHLEDLSCSAGGKTYDLSSLYIEDIKGEYRQLLGLCEAGTNNKEEVEIITNIKRDYEEFEALLKGCKIDDDDAVLTIFDESEDVKTSINSVTTNLFSSMFNLNLAKKIIKKTRKFNIAAFTGWLHTLEVRSLLVGHDYTYGDHHQGILTPEHLVLYKNF